MTRVPRPVTILKPRLSWTASLGVCWRSPEMISASLGSATRQHILNRTNATTAAATTTMTMVTSHLQCSHTGHDHRSRRVVLDHDDAGAGLELVVRLRGVGVEGFAAAADLDHHLAQLPGADGAGDPAHLPDHPLICHRSIASRACSCDQCRSPAAVPPSGRGLGERGRTRHPHYCTARSVPRPGTTR